MSAPNTEGTSNPFVLSGGVFGVIVGNSSTEPVGFYGNAGTTQQSLSGLGITLTQALENLGLVVA